MPTISTPISNQFLAEMTHSQNLQTPGSALTILGSSSLFNTPTVLNQNGHIGSGAENNNNSSSNNKLEMSPSFVVVKSGDDDENNIAVDEQNNRDNVSEKPTTSKALESDQEFAMDDQTAETQVIFKFLLIQS